MHSHTPNSKIPRQTRVVATIGPATCSQAQLRALCERGVNVLRLNFSHGTHEWHRGVIERIKELRATGEFCPAIMLDTKGPEIRTGDVAEAWGIAPEEMLTLTIEPGHEPAVTGKLSVNYDGLVRDARLGEMIMMDSGLVRLQVEAKTDSDVLCRVLDEGKVTSRRHLNLPGVRVSLPSVTEQDWEDLAFGAEMGVDLYALSFIRSAEDVSAIREFLRARGAVAAHLIAKIETPQAVDDLADIVSVADGVMVARGDLGVETAMSAVPILQRRIVKQARAHNKPVIVATHMLESMIESPVPTRAEVSDVFAAVLQSVDGVMLSGETASGEYPLRAVEQMVGIITEGEAYVRAQAPACALEADGVRCELARVAVRMAADLCHVQGIVVMSRTGYMARLVAGLRPSKMVYVFTDRETTYYPGQLLRGVEWSMVEFDAAHPEATVQRAAQKLSAMTLNDEPRQYIVISDSLIDGKMIPMIQVRTLG